jgi:hypothetical protein
LPQLCPAVLVELVVQVSYNQLNYPVRVMGHRS